MVGQLPFILIFIKIGTQAPTDDQLSTWAGVKATWLIQP